jgi:hypothetical protein
MLLGVAVVGRSKEELIAFDGDWLAVQFRCDPLFRPEQRTMIPLASILSFGLNSQLRKRMESFPGVESKVPAR